MALRCEDSAVFFSMRLRRASIAGRMESGYMSKLNKPSNQHVPPMFAVTFVSQRESNDIVDSDQPRVYIERSIKAGSG